MGIRDRPQSAPPACSGAAAKRRVRQPRWSLAQPYGRGADSPSLRGSVELRYERSGLPEREGLDRGLNGGSSHVEIVRDLAPPASRHVLIPADPSAGPVLSPDPIGG